jgi:hypothetical protein
MKFEFGVVSARLLVRGGNYCHGVFADFLNKLLELRSNHFFTFLCLE